MLFLKVLHSNNKAFFMPTVIIYLIIMIMFILLQTMNVLSYQYSLQAKENNLYLQSGINMSYKAILDNNKSFLVNTKSCTNVFTNILSYHDDDFKVDVDVQCHKLDKVMNEGSLKPLGVAYKELKHTISNSKSKVSNKKYMRILDELNIIKSYKVVKEVVDTGETVFRLVITGGADLGYEVFKLAIDKVSTLSDINYKVYNINITKANITYKILAVYSKDSEHSLRTIYTIV